jgi:hypothetical protein
MRWAGHVALTADMRNEYKILIVKPEGKRQLGRPRHIWKGNSKMDVTEIVCVGLDWIHLAQDRDQWLALVNIVMKLRIF